MTPATGDEQEAARLADLARWQDRLDAARQTQDDDLRSAAEKWAGTISVLIGAVASISVVVAPKALKDFNNGELRNWTLVLLIGAGALGLAAMIAAIAIAQGIPRIKPEMDAGKYKTQTLGKRAAAVTWLRLSQYATLLAVAAVIAASVLSQVDAVMTAPAAVVNVVVVHMDGSATCGPIGATAGSSGVVSVTVVDHC